MSSFQCPFCFRTFSKRFGYSQHINKCIHKTYSDSEESKDEILFEHDSNEKNKNILNNSQESNISLQNSDNEILKLLFLNTNLNLLNIYKFIDIFL